MAFGFSGWAWADCKEQTANANQLLSRSPRPSPCPLGRGNQVVTGDEPSLIERHEGPHRELDCVGTTAGLLSRALLGKRQWDLVRHWCHWPT